jgi:hypothetical protein
MGQHGPLWRERRATRGGCAPPHGSPNWTRGGAAPPFPPPLPLLLSPLHTKGRGGGRILIGPGVQVGLPLGAPLLGRRPPPPLLYIWGWGAPQRHDNCSSVLEASPSSVYKGGGLAGPLGVRQGRGRSPTRTPSPSRIPLWRGEGREREREKERGCASHP